MEAFRKAVPHYGVAAPTDEFMIKNIFGSTNADIFRKFINANATDAECAEFNDRKVGLYFDICLASPEKFRLADGAAEMLDFLKENGVPYCIATGSNREEMDFFIKHLGLERWFSFDENILYTDGSFKGKPAPDCYILAAKKLGLTPAECLVFEDGTTGMLSATAAGAGVLVAMYESGMPDPVSDRARVDAVYHDFHNWRELLSRYGLFNERT